MKDTVALESEAEDCRRKALTYLGQPEAPFLLHIARAFEMLAKAKAPRSPNSR